MVLDAVVQRFPYAAVASRLHACLSCTMSAPAIISACVAGGLVMMLRRVSWNRTAASRGCVALVYSSSRKVPTAKQSFPIAVKLAKLFHLASRARHCTGAGDAYRLASAFSNCSGAKSAFQESYLSSVLLGENLSASMAGMSSMSHCRRPKVELYISDPA